MTKPYAATIEGKPRKIIGIDDQQHLVLVDGERYTFERLNYNPSGQPPDERDGDIFGWPLLETVRLQSWQGDWKWNDEPLTLEKWMESELQNLCDKRGIPPKQRTEQIKISALLRTKPGKLHLHYMTRALCYSRLKHLPAAVWEQVNGVAWFEHDDGAGGWNTPILLKSFRPLPSSASPKVEASKSAPDYFTSTKAAADYAGITERTIFNWKNRGWLKVEQVGKKIRIAKSELDKCINRQ